MRKSLFKKMTASVMALTLVVGMVALVPAATKKGTDISSGVKWSPFSVHTREDKGKWEDELIKDGQVYNNTENVYKSYSESASLSTNTASAFTMDIKSTGSSATWAPTKGKYDDCGNNVWEAIGNNPWGVTATKILKIEKGRTYTISFKIKSTLSKEVKKTEDVKGKYCYSTKDKSGKTVMHYIDESKTKTIKKDGRTCRVETVTGDQNLVSHVGTTVSTGKDYTVKHIHIKAYRNKEADGDPAISGTTLKATYKGKNVVSTTKKDGQGTSYKVISLDSKNDDYTEVTMKVTVPGDNIAYKQSTMGIKFAFGSFYVSYPDENDMSGTIEVKDFKVVAGEAVSTSKLKSVKAGKNKIVASTKKVKGAKVYEFQYARNKNFTGKVTVRNKKAKVTLKGKKIKSKKNVWVRVRVKTSKGYTVWSNAKKVTVK